MLVTSYARGAWTEKVVGGLRKVLAHQPVELNVRYYNSDFWERQTQVSRVEERNRILSAIKNYNPNIIVYSDDEVIQLLGHEISLLQKPIFFTGINSTSDWIKSQTGLVRSQYSIVTERYPCSNAIRLLSKLGRPVKNVGVLSNDFQITSKFIFNDCIKDLQNHSSANIVFKVKSSYLVDWLDGIKGSKVNAVVLLVPYNVTDVNGSEIPITTLGKILKTKIRVPIVGILDVDTKAGIDASFNLDASELGAKTGRQIIAFFKLHKLGAHDSVSADKYEVNIADWSERFGPIPKSYNGLRAKTTKLIYGR